MKRVPIPSVGRIVLFEPVSGIAIPAIVTAVHVEFDRADPKSYRNPRGPLPATYYKVDLVSFDGVVGRKIAYGDNKPGCWWWPPRITDEMEVD